MVSRGRGGPQVTQRDRQVLAWIGAHGIVTAEQVARRFWVSGQGDVGKRAAYRRLAVLEQMGLIRRDRTPFWRAPWVIRITAYGGEVGDVAVRPARIVESEIRHALSLVDLTEQLVAVNPGAVLKTEREIRTDRWHERHAGTRAPARGRTPDAEMTPKGGKRVAIELDLTPKRTKDYERILRSYKQERYDLVWWYVVPGAVDRVARMVLDNRADDFVEVRPWKPTYVTTLH